MPVIYLFLQQYGGIFVYGIYPKIDKKFKSNTTWRSRETVICRKIE
jgi:hypothetical protein